MPKTDPPPEEEFAEALEQYPLPWYCERHFKILAQNGRYVMEPGPRRTGLIIHHVNAYPAHVAEIERLRAKLSEYDVLEQDARHICQQTGAPENPRIIALEAGAIQGADTMMECPECLEMRDHVTPCPACESDMCDPCTDEACFQCPQCGAQL